MPKHLPPSRGKHGLRFSHSQWYPQWDASTELANSPFGRSTLDITVHGGTAWEPVTEEELSLIDCILDWLPDLLPLIVAKLREWDESLTDEKVFRETFKQPSICLFDRGDYLTQSWTFVVERLGFEGDNWGVHLKFAGRQFVDKFAGD